MSAVSKTFKRSVLLAVTAAALALPMFPSWAETEGEQVAALSGAERSTMQDDLRLALDRVALDAQTGKTDKAFAQIEKLKSQYPDNPQVLAAEADLQFRIGNRGTGFARLNRAVQIDPSDEDILGRQQAAILSHKPFSNVGYTYRRTDAANEQFLRLGTQIEITPSIAASIQLENDYLRSRNPIVRTDGVARSFSGNRQRGSMTVSKSYESGNEASLSLYANDDTVGGGGQYGWWDYDGVTRVEADLNRPDWEYVEMVIERGTKSNIRLERKQILSEALQVTVGGGYNHYALDRAWDVAQGIEWDVNLGYSRPYALFGASSSEVTLGANYTADAEYFTAVERRTSAAGTRYKPLPVKDYEVHAATLSVGKELVPQLTAEAYGGYGVNRLSDNHGPLFGGSVTYSPLQKLGIELRAARTEFGGTSNTQTEEQVGVNLKWLW